MKRFGKFFAIISCVFAVFSANAQDPQFTQFYANPLYLNPAFAGSMRCPRLTLNYRNQWPAIPRTSGYSTFVTTSAGYDQHIDAISGGIGILVVNDRQGGNIINTTTASGIYSYQININRNFSIKAGLQATFLQKFLDWDKLTFGDMIDQRYGFIYPTNEQRPGKLSKATVDFSAGALGFSKKYYFGVAVHHLTQPDETLINGESKLPRKYTVHAGGIIPFKPRKPEEGSISPNILFQQQQNFTQLNLGLYVTKGAFVGGLWYRNQDAFILLIGVQSDMFKMGYSYDITISKLSSNTAGSHELSMTFQFDCRPKRRRFRTISCPSF